MFETYVRRALALALVTVCVAAVARAEYPVERVRFKWDAGTASPVLRTENRIVVKSFWAEPTQDGEGIQLRGEVYTDFEVVAHADFKAGQMLELPVSVVLTRFAGAAARGQQIATQFVSIKTSEVLGGYGCGDFSLPALPRPLPPGRYVLTVGVAFNSMTARQRDALLWCDDWYDQDTRNDADARAKAHANLLLQGKVECHADLYVGDMRGKHGGVELGKADAEKLLCLDGFIQIVGDVIKTEENLANALKTGGAMGAALAKNTQAALARIGGNSSDAERKEFERLEAIRKRLQAAIDAFEDARRAQYRRLVDCVIFYGGYLGIDTPGRHVRDAIARNDNKKDAEERKRMFADASLRAANEKEAAAAADQYAKEDRHFVLDYYDARLAKDVWDSAKFTKVTGGKVAFDATKWRSYVLKACETFLRITQQLIDELDDSGNYCVNLWPEAFAQAVQARDGVLALGFAYEYELRLAGGEQAQSLKTEFEALADEQPDLAASIRTAIGATVSSKQTAVTGGIAAVKTLLRPAGKRRR